MRNIKGSSVFAALTAIVVCGTLVAPAHAWSWPWEKESATASSNATPDAANAPLNSGAPVAATAAGSKNDGPSIMSGTVESFDMKSHSLILKTSAGKTAPFALAKSFVIRKHHRTLDPSALKNGERVNVYYRPGSNEAVRVYLLGSHKVRRS